MSSAAAGLPLVTPLPALNDSANIFRDRFAQLSDEEWRDILIRSEREPEIDGILFPGFPAAEMQEQMHGHSGETSLREAQGFYSFVKSFPDARRALRPGARFLDFGTGWGRMARMFLRDFDLSDIYGFEPNRGYCAVARSLNPYICVLNGGFTPDCTLPEDRFDLVVGWSIFSHLTEQSAGDWLEELARAMRRDGCGVFTCWGDRFLDLLVAENERLRRDENADIHWYYRQCLRGAGDIARRREEFADGEFVWFSAFGYELYGEAFIHPTALATILRERKLPFDIVAFDRTSLFQDAFVLRRTETWSAPVIIAAPEDPPDRGKTEPRTSAGAANPSFCVHPWNHFRIEGEGEGLVCCAFQGGRVGAAGVPLSLAEHSLDEIWNSDFMRTLRRDMIEGRRIPGCAQCYADEARGGISQRLRDNASFEAGWLNPDQMTLSDIVRQTIDDDYRVARLPAMIEIEIGNLCNLKCRMCSGNSSTLIAKGPVHHKWAEGHRDPGSVASPYHLRRPDSVDLLARELAKDGGGQVKRLYFIGGEPLLAREVRTLLDGLAAAGHAHDIELSFVSNGSAVPRWLSLAPQFRRVDFAISVDGFGSRYEYIRYPASWAMLVKNIRRLREMPNVHVVVTSTIQINNALHITDLFRYLDTVEVGFTAYLLHWPLHLAPAALPAPVRAVAAARLREYGDGDCLPPHRALVASLTAQFEADIGPLDPALLRDFMRFTNDLDATRGQNIHQTDPELVDLLAQAGFPWSGDRLHAAAAE